MDIRYHKTARGRVLGVEAGLADISRWTCSVGQARDVLLSGFVVGANMLDIDLPAEAVACMPTQEDVEVINEWASAAARAGRLIDFGTWSNDVIKYCANRGGPLYNKGAIGHPFREPWLFFHHWESETSLYLVLPYDEDHLAGGCQVMELTPIRLKTQPALIIGDRCILDPDRDNTNWRSYQASAMPSPWRFLPGAEAINNHSLPQNAAAGNVLDPLMTALLILSTRGIDRQTVAASAKLQKARAKNGKPAIPPYDVIDSRPYVTAISNRIKSGRKVPMGGTHASPVAHIRMGHPRNLPSGEITFVRDALVNASADSKAAFARTRSHYVVKS